MMPLFDRAKGSFRIVFGKRNEATRNKDARTPEKPFRRCSNSLF